MLDNLLDDSNVGEQYASLMAGVWKTEVVEYDQKEDISIVIINSQSDRGLSMYEIPDPFRGR